ncbi:hypothetical protein ACFVYP_14115 [Kitasatospora sp. NPDC058201]|uniref:hypothetical protein n=1 Tax=unclassified Kitasatospora TaxID=2633591 RepID=UPI003653D326
MTAPAPGADGQSGRPPTAQHFSVAQEPETPEGYVAPGMPGAPVAGYHPTAPGDSDGPDGHPRSKRRYRTGRALAIAVAAMLAGALAYGLAPTRAAATVGWLAIAPAAAVAWPLGRLGGPGRLLPPLGALLSAGSLLLGQLLGQTRRLHALDGTPYGELVRDALTLWRGDRRLLDLVFYGIALVGGFLLTRRAATRQ